jgi:hypothetical protein
MEDLVVAFEGTDCRETTAMLAGIAHLGLDEFLRRRAARIVASRREQLPRWFSHLGESVAYAAYEMVHILGDGDNVMIGVRLPDETELTVVLYIDHNLGSVAKDGFVLAKPLDELIEFMKLHEEAPGDTQWLELPPADARARIEEAIAIGAMTVPPLETDVWPGFRPLVEWAVRLLPEGGVGYTRPDWTEAERQSLTDSFFMSRYSQRMRTGDNGELFESLLWFGCDYGPGDPLRWSPVAVEILLADWIPRKIVADVEFLSKAPALLRAFIQYAHEVREIPSRLTVETLAAVDQWEPEYQRLIRSKRPQGPEALLAAVGALDPDLSWGEFDDEDEGEFHDAVLDPGDLAARVLESLQEAVGGEKALSELKTDPLPDEAFHWEDIPDDIRPAVGEIQAWCDRCCDELLTIEHRTACRRFLAMAARGGPQVFRRRARAEKAAASVCWIIGKANDLFQPYGRGMQVKDLEPFFGIPKSTVSQRAKVLMEAAGIFSEYDYVAWDLPLGTPELLISARRRTIIERRDTCMEELQT